jgi:uncharacterized protein (TIGR00369 family)
MGEIIRGHDQILQHAYEVFNSIPMPRGVQLILPPPCAREIKAVFIEYVPSESLSASVDIPPHYANAVGVLQGGFLAALFDNLMAPLSLLVAKGPTTSLDLTTYFLHPVLPGERLTLIARAHKAGRTVQHIAANATNEQGKLVATASSTFQVLSVPA